MQSNPYSIRLSKLLLSLPEEFLVASNGDLEQTNITNIASDSRNVQPGNLFVAVAGHNYDAHRFIPDAIRQGAAAVVGTQSLPNLEVPYVCVSDSRRSLPFLAAGFYHYPARHLTLLGVTGTDGKTTTTNLLHKILLAAGFSAGMISTVGAVIGEQEVDTGFHVTTPEAIDVQRFLAQMVSVGLTHVVLETTSHGFAQHRVDACEFDVGVITNITHEHLNDHGTFENYRAAKSRLLTELAVTQPKFQGNPRLAVLNRDDNSFEYLCSIVDGLESVHWVSYGLHPEADLRAENVLYAPGGLRCDVVGLDKYFHLESKLTGRFNVYNCLAAVAAAIEGLHIEVKDIQNGIAALNGVPGRMEIIDLGQDFLAMVDFAHTPNALQNVLATVREISQGGRIIALFGSAGLRDRQKRIMMSEISIDMADITILTAEDPRTESLDAILSEMGRAAEARGGQEGCTYWRIADRGQAVRFAVSLAQPGDVVVACGKGHEQSMCFGTIEYPWDDRVAMRSALSERLNIPGPAMPFLPTQSAEDAGGNP